jgi:OOP family OmpA-OmpF porin
MRTSPFLFSILSVALITAGTVSAQAADGKYYDPTNAASTSGKTVGYELYKTIGCPGRGLLDPACPVPAAAAAPAAAPAPAPAPTVAPAPTPAPVDGDDDHDGVPNSKDKCPATPAGQKVDADGCELDSDGDGIVDSKDKCPTVFAKTEDGCPPVAPLTLSGVNFDNDMATLRPDALATLDRAAESLKARADVKVEVAGHTDSRNSDAYNMSLSLDRANAVRDYLIGKGIAADRLTAKGYGESQPVADNATEEGRFQNRRVELVPQMQM